MTLQQATGSAATVEVDRARGFPAPALRRRDHLLTILFATWLVAGLAIDGWAHNNIIDTIESFFTPWHAVFYSGYAATAAWMIWICTRDLRGRQAGFAELAGHLRRPPAGYGLGLVGVVVFGVGGVGDLIWHSIFGIEQDLEQLLSPTHLTLLLGMLLIATSPWRAAWRVGGRRPASFTEFLPALLSLTLTVAVVEFFFQFMSTFTTPDIYTVPWNTLIAGLSNDFPHEDFSQTVGVAALLVTNLILLAPVLLMLRRWDPPVGAVTFLFGLVAIVMGAQLAFQAWQPIAVAVLAGIAADLLIARFHPSPARPTAHRMIAMAIPAILWLLYFGMIEVLAGIGWTPDLWAGTIVLATLSGLGLSLLTIPAPVPGAAAGLKPGEPQLQVEADEPKGAGAR